MPSQPTETRLSSLIDQTIDRFFDNAIDQAADIDQSYQRLWQTMSDLVRAGGKRLRPRMTLLAYQAFGGDDVEPILPIAAAQELLHFGLLIHDDIIDRDYVRHGVPNVAGRYKTLYGDYFSDTGDQIHFAHSTAILAGDLMISSAHQLIADSQINPDRRARAQQLLSTAMFETAGGELLDTELSFMPYAIGDALKVARYKTASYSFVGPLLTGAQLAFADPSQTAKLKRLAVALGVAYQLVDDLLGVFGDNAVTGKSTTSDIVEGKTTYLVERAVSLMSDHDKASFDLAFGNQIASDHEISVARQLLISTGAKAEVESKIADCAAQVRRTLRELSIDEQHEQEFERLIARAIDRNK